MLSLARRYSIRNEIRINGNEGAAKALEELLDALIERAEGQVKSKTGSQGTSAPACTSDT